MNDEKIETIKRNCESTRKFLELSKNILKKNVELVILTFNETILEMIERLNILKR